MAGFANYTHPPFLETLKGLLSGKSRMAGMEQALSNPNPQAQAHMRAKMEELARLDPEAIARESYGAKSLYGALQEALPQATVTTTPGTGVLDDEPSDIAAAVETAQAADVVILAVGGRSVAFAGRATEGEGSDAATIDLPSNQIALIEAVASLGKPVIAVIYMGKPYALTAIEPLVSAIVTGYIPGPEGGAALAGVMTGAVVPSGKLPFTIPRHVGQTPLYHSQKRGSGQRRTDADQFKGYVDLENSPLYPFGYGLSYTSFAFRDLVLTPPKDLQSEFTVQATVQNTGELAGAEVVQVYVSPPSHTITRPERELGAFARVTLKPDEAVRLSFSIDMRQLGYTCEDGGFVVDPGEYRVRVGNSSEELPLSGSFTVEGDRTPVLTPHAFLPRIEYLDQ
jgi:beta-xylosidase